jgi:broad specificity phosphatase PhoE
VARTIFLARHGETEWNRLGRWQGATDIPLSEVGRAQARALGDRLRGRGIGAAYASDLSRAHETATIIAGMLGLAAPAADARLRERGYGRFEGLTREECEARFPEVWARYLADRRATPPEAEPQSEIIARATAALHDIASGTADGASVLVISHGGTIRSFASAAIGVVLPPIENGSVFRVRFEDGKFVSAQICDDL